MRRSRRQASSDGGPLPQFELAYRVGALDDDEPFATYDRIGRAIRESIESRLPPDWSWDGKLVLDFGCGAGRVLRHFLDQARAGTTLVGCDLDRPSIDWINEHLVPPLAEAVVNDAVPPLPFDPDRFDLVVATSVFTHIADGWADWLLELRRVLKPDGLLISSFMGAAMSESIVGEPWVGERIGMNVVSAPHDETRVNVLHSPWWLRAHWGRAFEIVAIDESGYAAPPGAGHGVVVARPRPEPVTAAELEAPEPGERRELIAAQHNVAQLRRYGEHMSWVVDMHRSSRSWRLTRPLRRAARLLRRPRG